MYHGFMQPPAPDIVQKVPNFLKKLKQGPILINFSNGRHQFLVSTGVSISHMHTKILLIYGHTE